MDPQHRLFLECAWKALEDAGYDPAAVQDPIGVYAGSAMNQYLVHNLTVNPELMKTVDDYQIMIGNCSDYLTTRVSYKLNLRGPSVAIGTACSTSLVAVQAACLGLLNYQCDMALSGGVSLRIPPTGYLFKEGHILSPSGQCRAFDADANGTVPGDGVGIVVLKRLEDAVKDRDNIYAVIIGAAINNDGAGKVGYTAPSVDGQASVIAMAHALAGVRPRDISYVETHGTGTLMGDPIEIEGLKKAFKSDGNENNYCALGAVKTNIGHLDAAAGVVGLIKTALALKHGIIPPTLHFSKPNPLLNLDRSPFFIPTEPVPWKAPFPRRAGVSSFGIGGTNAHAVLEESPAFRSEPSAKKWHALPVSARSENALLCASGNLSSFLESTTDSDIADIAFTLQQGRKAFAYRKAVVCRTAPEAAESLRLKSSDQALAGFFHAAADARVIFMFSGQGSQYAGMSRQLYENEPWYRGKIDHCCDIVSPLLGVDLRGLLFPPEPDRESASDLLSRTLYTQPALFVLEYCLAYTLMQWGIRPAAMIGHSIGEYVAACISGVMDLDDALRLIVERARIMQQQPPGVMLSISASEDQVKTLLDSSVEMALVNGPQLCVVGGLSEAIGLFENKLTSNNIQHRRLRTSHAFHTSLMKGAMEPLGRAFENISLKVPSIPFISNVSGTWITIDQARDSRYWLSQLHSTVQFSRGVRQLLVDPDALFVEIGPGNTLCTMVSMQATSGHPVTTVQTLPHALQEREDEEMFLSALARLWVSGASIDWAKTYGGEPRRRVSLPTYPFERKRFWIGPPENAKEAGRMQPSLCEEESGPIKVAKKMPSQPHVGEAHPRPNLPNIYNHPTTTVETYLVELWQRLLGIKPIGILDNYFDLGGQSLLAVQIFNEIYQKYNVRLPLAALIEHNTVRALAAHLREVAVISDEAEPSKPAATAARKPIWNSVVSLQREGDLPPFFCVAGVGGNPMSLRYLSAALGKRQPFYGLQYRGVDGALKPHETMEDIAAEFLADMQRIQPEGPYYLGGYSFGGVVAYEVAQLILKQGKKVGALVLIDASNPAVMKWSFKRRVLAHLALVRKMGPGKYFTTWLNRKRLSYERRFEAIAAQKGVFAYRLELVRIANARILEQYIPAPLDANVMLIKSELREPTTQGIGVPPHESNGWRSLISPEKFNLHIVHCKHLDFETEVFATKAAKHIADGLAALRDG
jgi:acyl transferase domain-containing protein/thioesterase domain-containing protein